MGGFREGVIGFLARDRTVAGPGFNRWLIPPAALLLHLSIGEIYAFSVFKNPLVERFGTGLTPIAIMGFGGALIASPLTDKLLTAYASNPVDAIVPSFLALGVIYLVAMMIGAFVVRLPAESWTPPTDEETSDLETTANVSAGSAIRTPQFWLLWTVLFCNVTAGIGLLEQAAPMIQDFFGVATAAAAGFVGLLALANMAGRTG